LPQSDGYEPDRKSVEEIKTHRGTYPVFRRIIGTAWAQQGLWLAAVQAVRGLTEDKLGGGVLNVITKQESVFL